jgi:hypothetical protein
VNRREEAEVLRARLSQDFPCGRPVYIQWVPVLRYYDKEAKKWKPCFADCLRVGRRIRIRMSISACSRKRDVWETFLHEWVHAMEWKGAAWEQHPAIRDGDRDHTPAFWAQYGELYEWFFHQGGCGSLGF